MLLWWAPRCQRVGDIVVWHHVRQSVGAGQQAVVILQPEMFDHHSRPISIGTDGARQNMLHVFYALLDRSRPS